MLTQRILPGAKRRTKVAQKKIGGKKEEKKEKEKEELTNYKNDNSEE